VAAPEPVAPPVESASAPQAEAAPATAKPAEPQAAPASAAKPDLAHGQQIYRQACAFCHDKGIAGAPKTGDAAAWTPRLAQGMDGVYASALRGKGAMPAKGGNPSLADADVKAAVDYLAAQSR
jgi:cytochrome c5